MAHSLLLTLAHQLAGEFDNRDQSLAEPAWFVHLRLWHCPVPLFMADSITFFAEQANALQLDRPYRQRLLRLQADPDAPTPLRIQYYSLKDPEHLRGAGQERDRLKTLTLEAIEALPGCVLQVRSPIPTRFVAEPAPQSCCQFRYQNEVRQVQLGFESEPEQFWSYDKGVESETGRALWGAIMGPYHFTKRRTFALETA